MKKLLKESKGITLIALVITIVVLIILAGVLINLTLGKNGLFKRSKVAKDKYEYAAAKETVDLKILEVQTECIQEGSEFTVKRVADKMGLGEEEAIEIIHYYTDVAKTKSGLTIPESVTGIVVIDVHYPKYKFLIGKISEGNVGVIGATDSESMTPARSEFMNLDEFEEKVIGIITSSEKTGKITSLAQLLEKNNIDSSTTVEEIIGNQTLLANVIEDKESAEYILDNSLGQICVSESAMTTLGQSTTAKELIKNSEIYSNTINNSNYWKKIYTKCIPIMTSDTLPSGEAKGYNIQGNIYEIFSGRTDYSSGGSGYGCNSRNSDHYVQYMFGDGGLIPRKVEFVNHYDNGYAGSSSGYATAGDGVNFVTIATFENLPCGVDNFIDVAFTNMRYKYFRCILTKPNNSYGGDRYCYHVFNVYGI